MRYLGLLAVVVLASLGASCANLTGDQTVAEYCENPAHARADMCENHAESVSLGQRLAQVFGIANRAQETADAAMARQLTCSTRTMRNTATGSCENGATLTNCTQTRYTRRAGGMAILRSIDDTQCRFNGRVLEVQVRCCSVGEPITQASAPMEEPTPPPQRSEPAPVS